MQILLQAHEERRALAVDYNISVHKNKTHPQLQVCSFNILVDSIQ